MPIILSLDIGTSKLAAVAFDCSERRNVAVFSTANAATVAGLAVGLHEQDPRSIYRDCLELLKRLLGSGLFEPSEVIGIALSGQMHGVLLVDRALEPLTNLITWCDQRAAGLCASLDRATWPAERAGCYLHPGYGGATLAVLAAERRIPGGALALSIADYVAAKLCGVAATELTQAAAWGIADLRRGAWDEELLARLSIPRGILPEIRSRSQGLGRLTASLGSGLSAGLPVHSPIGDNQASYIGAGADAGAGATARAVLINLGTGGQISIPSEAYAFKVELETRPLPAGGYLLVGASLCGGRSYAMLKDFFRATLREFGGREPDDAELYEVMNRLAAAEPGQGAERLRVDTRFAGTRMDPSFRGRIEGIGIDGLTPAALCRGVALGMVRELTEQVPAELRRGLGRVLASGNAVRSNPLVQRLIGEELGLPCLLSTEREEAATGAALVAANSSNRKDH
jgi:sedoheptulokinase